MTKIKFVSGTPWLLAWPILASLSTFPTSGPRTVLKLLLILAMAAWGWWNWNRPERLIPIRLRWLPIILSILTVAAFTAMGMLEYANYSNYDSGDIIHYLAPFYTSTGWLPGAVPLSGRAMLALHSEFLCIPIGWLYKLAPWPMTILIAQGVSSLTAWVLFRNWLVKRSADKVSAEWLAFGFALAPCTVGILLKGFHGVALGLPFLVLSATAYYDGKWRKFLISLCFLLMAKEVFVVSAISLGTFAIVQRRSWKWVLVPIALGLGYGLFLRTWYFPMMLKDSTYYYDSFFGGWRAAVARLSSLEAIQYILRLLLWAGAVSVLRTPFAMLAIPSAGFYLILGNFIDTRSHYFLEPSFWIFFAMAAGTLENLHQGSNFNPTKEKWLFSFIACMLIMNITLYQDLPFYRHHKFEKSYREAIVNLPTDASVGLGIELEDHLFKVHRYYWLRYGGISTKQPCTWAGEFNLQGGVNDYALLFKGFGSAGFLPEEKDRIRHCWAALEKDTTYKTIWEDSLIVLLKKRD